MISSGNYLRGEPLSLLLAWLLVEAPSFPQEETLRSTKYQRLRPREKTRKYQQIGTDREQYKDVKMEEKFTWATKITVTQTETE